MMDVHYEDFSGLPPEPLMTALLTLLGDIFTNQSIPELQAKLQYQRDRTGLHVMLAVADERVVGCKLGYEEKPSRFYSWLGGVHPDFRARGIASELMHQQHDWCRRNGYHTVRTQTYNQWRSMLLLNLRMGFDIIGTVQGQYGLIIMLEKKLQ